MRTKGYGQFCPIAIAAEVLSERWTLLVLRELLMGSSRFNDLHRGVPLMSTSLLSQRLRELERAGLVRRTPLPSGKSSGYCLTEAGEALRPIIEDIGAWSMRHMNNHFASGNLDPNVLMWDIRRHVQTERMPPGKIVIRFEFPDAPVQRQHYWLVKDDEEQRVDLCVSDPGFPVGLTVSSKFALLTRVWLGDIDIAAAVRRGLLHLDGRGDLRASFYDWFALSPFAPLGAKNGLESTTGRGS